MRKRLKNWLAKAVGNNIFWGIVKPVALFGVHCQNARNSMEEEKSSRTNTNYFHSDHVLNGPFKGMNYPVFEAVGSSYHPKILGSYEAELWGIMEYLKTGSFDAIYDIGCAEGYYANGLARNFPHTPVHAYDIDSKAQELCLEIASANNLQNVHVSGEAQPELLAGNVTGKKALVISDCEGFEKELFPKAFAPAYSNTYLVIEMHDFMDLAISDELKSSFSGSHHLISIFSVDDLDKLKRYRFSELNPFDKTQRYQLIREGRPGKMEWLIGIPKSERTEDEIRSLLTELDPLNLNLEIDRNK